MDGQTGHTGVMWRLIYSDFVPTWKCNVRSIVTSVLCLWLHLLMFFVLSGGQRVTSAISSTNKGLNIFKYHRATCDPMMMMFAVAVKLTDCWCKATNIWFLKAKLKGKRCLNERLGMNVLGVKRQHGTLCTYMHHVHFPIKHVLINTGQ